MAMKLLLVVLTMLPAVLSVAVCEDDPQVDCPYLDQLLKICNNIQEAITACPNYCNVCPVDGGWSDWSDWSSCNVTCDSGVQTRNRQCDNPSPLNAGLPCSGDNTDMMTCDNNPCPVHGGWSAWSEWGTCSATCGVGIQRRDRHCSNPYPDQYGDHCFGDSRDDRLCKMSPCTVGQEGSWSEWLNWGDCSKTCGGGMTTRTRVCSGDGSLYCLGNNEQRDICNLTPCQDDTWSTWSEWHACSTSCGGGMRKRQRQCRNNSMSSIGTQCAGNNEDVDLCNITPCTSAVCHEGSWSEWLNWGDCSRTCGGGITTRTRVCSGNGGVYCLGNNEQRDICNMVQCQGETWSTWSEWHACSASCGGGMRKRQRQCRNNSTSSLGAQCVGNNEDMDLCNTIPCPSARTDVVFVVYGGGLTSASGTVIFPNVYHNTGMGYSSPTGKFTAPLSGLYSFTAQICNDVTTNFFISKNGNHFATGTVFLNNNVQCSPSTGTTKLNKGDIVDVYSSTSIENHSANSFTGLLIHSYE